MKYSIRCTLLSAKHKDGTHTIRMRVSWNRRRVTHYLDTPVPASGWDTDAGMPKRTYTKALREIRSCVAAVDGVFDLAHVEKRIPSEEDLRLALGDIELQEPETHLVSDLVRSFISEESVSCSWASGTKKRFRVLLSHLTAWRPDAIIEEVDEEFVKQFMSYLYTTGMINSTLSKFLSQFRWFMRWCLRNGYTDTSSWDYRPKIKETEKDVVYLTEEELKRVMDLDFPDDPGVGRARDSFLFCCFTGLRYSDVAKLSWADVHEDHIRVVTKKTNDPLRIELNAISAAMIEKYRPADPRPADLVFPVISNQKMNDHLKVIGRKAELNDPVRRVFWVQQERREEVVPKWQLLSTHCGRRTFVVTALTLEIPSEVIMRWTGHNDTKSMKPYMEIVDKLKKASMSKFDKLASKMTEI